MYTATAPTTPPVTILRVVLRKVGGSSSAPPRLQPQLQCNSHTHLVPRDEGEAGHSPVVVTHVEVGVAQRIVGDLHGSMA